jgi:hypothetical protein
MNGVFRTSELLFKAGEILIDAIDMIPSAQRGIDLGSWHIISRSDNNAHLQVAHWNSLNSHTLKRIEFELKKIGLKLSGYTIKKLTIDFFISGVKK